MIPSQIADQLDLTDPLALTQALIRCRSVTPTDDGAIDLVAGLLTRLGFTCHTMTFGEGTEGTNAAIRNLYARRDGSKAEEGQCFAFAGHTDVVPPGDEAAWRIPPFDASVTEDGWLIGRGSADMKGNIAAFISATAAAVADGTADKGALSFIITGDEEGPALNGTTKILDWMADRGEQFDLCLVGEPTGVEKLGDTIKIGRRGSFTAKLTVTGVQGHVAYPHRADNPLHPLVRMLNTLVAEPLDDGTEHFESSTLQITTIDVDNPAHNVIPSTGTATFNSRFNDLHTAESLEAEIRRRLDSVGVPYDLSIRVSAHPFLTQPNEAIAAVVGAIEESTGLRPEMTTGGGTSDARFITRMGPVFEFGLIGDTIHQVDERVPAHDLQRLSDAYYRIIERFFALPAN
ncbi:MAG: succinyl-diaminopimelate desuccinylase [Alphaproteobacteria bacterium]|nr:succinyl-diaminopimelate desuccinylase [Alphaproteobacteria bacterium SS10]